MILSDTQIKKQIAEGYLITDGFKDENLTPNGYDLTIESISMEGKEADLKGIVDVPTGTWFAISTKEYVKFPENIAGELWIRTSWARKGVLASFGMIDAGFHGNLTLSAFNTYRKVEIPVGETFAQMTFHFLGEGSEKSYAERSGNYQGQRGIKL